MKNLSCQCGNDCQKAEMGFPAGIKLQVPMCLMISGVFKDRKVMESMKHFTLMVLSEEVEKVSRELEDGKRFWERVEKNLEEEKPPLA